MSLLIEITGKESPTITKCGFIDLWTWTPRSIGGLKTLATSDHDLFLAAFITNIAELEFSAHTSLLPP